MKFPVFVAFLFSLTAAFAELPPDELAQIGQKVWRNECAGTVEGLTSWNSGEDFASLGLGHFIWYPPNRRGPFEESFPDFVKFTAAHGTPAPAWANGPCPWNSRVEFQRDFHGERLTALRKFLAATVGLQTQFLVQRMEAALPKMLANAPATAGEKVQRKFHRLSASARGTFALIDYVNFKGEGTLATERYKGEGWGLLQVLEQMGDSQNAVRDFSAAAQKVLTRRVQNAPPARHEERWLPGWKNRVASYGN